jgi:hypothetical protein
MMQLVMTMLAVQGVVLLILRPIVWWYFGIGRAIRALESVDSSLKCLPAVREIRSSLRRAS